MQQKLKNIKAGYWPNDVAIFIKYLLITNAKKQLRNTVIAVDLDFTSGAKISPIIVQGRGPNPTL